MRLLLLSVFLILGSSINAQSTISGTVFSGAYLGPLYGAHLRSGSHTTKSDHQGKFQLLITESEPLIISHSKYHTQQISADRLGEGQALKFYLTPGSDVGSDFLLSAGVEKIYTPDFEHVFDYTFLEDTLVVISYMGLKPTYDRQSNTFLNSALTIFHYGKLIERSVLPEYIYGLVHTPSNELVLHGAKYAYIMNRKYGKIQTLPFDLEVFYNAIQPVYAETQNARFYAFQYRYLPQMAHRVELKEEKSDYLVRLIQNHPYFSMVDDDFTMLSKSEKDEAKEMELETGVNSKFFAPFIRSFYLVRDTDQPYAPGVMVDKKIAIIDHLNKWMFLHDSLGRALDSIPIYHGYLYKEEIKRVIQDPFSKKLYTYHDRSGVALIRELDFETGATGRPLKLKHPFPEQVKIFEGYVYYLFKTPLDDNTRHIFREKLPFGKSNGAK